MSTRFWLTFHNFLKQITLKLCFMLSIPRYGDRLIFLPETLFTTKYFAAKKWAERRGRLYKT
jgi:hypothetical protein